MHANENEDILHFLFFLYIFFGTEEPAFSRPVGRSLFRLRRIPKDHKCQKAVGFW